MNDLNAYAVEELDATGAGRVNGGNVLGTILGKVVDSAIEHVDQIVDGFKQAYDPCTR